MIKEIAIQEVEYISFKLAREKYGFDEPIPDFSTRYPSVLEKCLVVPFQTFQKKPLYKGMLAKAGILFYIMVKNHPFQNGNKRIAMTTTLLFFMKNNKWLYVDQQELYNFTIWIASSPAPAQKQAVEAIEGFFKRHIGPFTMVNSSDKSGEIEKK